MPFISYIICHCVLFAVDHTGGIILFESSATPPQSFQFERANVSHSSFQPGSRLLCAFAILDVFHSYYPAHKNLLLYDCCLHLTMEGDEGVRRSSPFQVDDLFYLFATVGWNQSNSILWENGSESGVYAYEQTTCQCTPI
jgi:hypothetical protein